MGIVLVYSVMEFVGFMDVEISVSLLIMVLIRMALLFKRLLTIIGSRILRMPDISLNL